MNKMYAWPPHGGCEVWSGCHALDTKVQLYQSLHSLQIQTLEITGHPFLFYIFYIPKIQIFHVMIIRVSAEMDVIFVGGFFKEKTPEIIHPLPIMGNNLLILSN